MSMNQFMHPRNIYKQPPNFKQLAIDYPEFRKYVTQDITGKVTLDFKNLEALRALTCTLLKKDFDIDLEIPTTKLIPTIPLRLNYILWVEDLLSLAQAANNIMGIDIGTGASCVYPLIIAKKNGWSMVASEIDPESIKYAEKNVSRNHLQNLIKLVLVQKDTLLEEVLTKHPNQYDFCMCNPPFFSSAQELHPFFKSRKPNRPHPRNAFCATIGEVVSKGGEVEYITRMIAESQKLGPKIKIYSTMIGHKSSLPPLKKLLRETGVVSFKQTEFCQGHTTRWGLAWTYLNLDLRQIPDSLAAAKQNLPKPFVFEIPKTLMSKVETVAARLIDIFKELQISYQEIKHVKNLVEFVVVAYSDTWSHQRRKRREKKRLQDESAVDNNNSSNTSSEGADIADKLAEISVDHEKKAKKRELEEDEDATDEDLKGYYNSKKIRTGLEESNPEKIFLKARISVIKVDESLGLELAFLQGFGTKDSLHRVLQYIKNNLVKKE